MEPSSVFWETKDMFHLMMSATMQKMVYDTLLSKVNIPSDRVHKIWTDITPEESAKQYAKTLHQYFDDRQTTFDLVLLGMGAKMGHTLSLFPSSKISHDQPW